MAGCGQLVIDYARGTMRIGELLVNGGDWITLNGSTGEVILGRVDTIDPELSGEFGELIHAVLNDTRHRLVILVYALTRLEVDIRIL